jgi:CO/xanthine dehydrogenase FAD-binding subunit
MSGMRYARPETLRDAVALLAEAPGRSAVLAGGTDLLVALRAGTRAPELVVDLKRIPEITAISWSEAGDLVLGAAVTMRRIHEDRRIRETYPALAEGAEAVGSFQVRCRATVGGNLANASPCMDTAPPLLLLEAGLRVLGPAGEREIPLDGFFLDVKKTVLAPGEILVSVTVPAASRKLRSAFEKLKRVEGHDLALVNAAAVFDPEQGALRAAIGSCGVTPVLTAPVTGVDPARAAQAADRLADAALDVIRPIDDVRAGAEYRTDMTALLCRRLAARLLGREGGTA